MVITIFPRLLGGLKCSQRINLDAEAKRLPSLPSRQMDADEVRKKHQACQGPQGRPCACDTRPKEEGSRGRTKGGKEAREGFTKSRKILAEW